MTQISNQVNVSQSPFQAYENTLQNISNPNAPNAPPQIQTDSCKPDSCFVLQSLFLFTHAHAI